jgi:hypothetical protein
MRVCKPNEAGAIFGQGGYVPYGAGSPFSFVSPAPAPAQIPAAVTQDTSAQEDLSFSSTDGGDGNTSGQVVAQATPPTFTSSMPNTVNTTVATSTDNTGWISTTINMPSSNTTTSPAINSSATASVPATINPTSNAQTSTPDMENTGLRPGDVALGAFGVNSALATAGGPVARAISLGVDVVANEFGIDVGTIAKLENFTTTPATTTVGPFGYPGYVQHGDLGFTAPSVPGTEICGPNYGLDQANPSTLGPSSATPSETGLTSSTLGGSDFGGYDFGGYDYGGYDATSSTASASDSSSSDSGGSDSGGSDSGGSDSGGSDSGW